MHNLCAGEWVGKMVNWWWGRCSHVMVIIKFTSHYSLLLFTLSSSFSSGNSPVWPAPSSSSSCHFPFGWQFVWTNYFVCLPFAVRQLQRTTATFAAVSVQWLQCCVSSISVANISVSHCCKFIVSLRFACVSVCLCVCSCVGTSICPFCVSLAFSSPLARTLCALLELLDGAPRERHLRQRGS